MIINKELANKIKSKTLNEYGIEVKDKVCRVSFTPKIIYNKPILKFERGLV